MDRSVYIEKVIMEHREVNKGVFLWVAQVAFVAGNTVIPSKHETFSQRWLNVGPASKTVGQH